MRYSRTRTSVTATVYKILNDVDSSRAARRAALGLRTRPAASRDERSTYIVLSITLGWEVCLSRPKSYGNSGSASCAKDAAERAHPGVRRRALPQGQWYLRFGGDVSGILPINDDKATAHESSKLNALASGVKRKGDFRRTEAILTSSYLE